MVVPSSGPCLKAMQVDDLGVPYASLKAMERAIWSFFADELLRHREEDDHDHDHDHGASSLLSRHVYVRQLPERPPLRQQVSDMLWTDRLQDQVLQHFPLGTRLIRDKPFDEVYLARPELDLVDDYKVHYDGILRLPNLCTIRALTYLGGPEAEFVALTSNHTTFLTTFGTAIVLDFNRELHYVNLTDAPNPRLLLKSAVHVITPDTHIVWTWVVIFLHRVVFFVVKSLRSFIESRSAHNNDNANNQEKLNGVPALGMILDNGMRTLNKIHMALPIATVALPLAWVLTAPLYIPWQLASYLTHVVLVCTRPMPRCYCIILVLLLRLIASIRLWQAPSHKFQTNNGAANSVLCLVLSSHIYMWAKLWSESSDDWSRPLIQGFSIFQKCTMTCIELVALWYCKQHEQLHQRCILRYLYVAYMHLAWLFLVAYFDMNATTAYSILLGK